MLPMRKSTIEVFDEVPISPCRLASQSKTYPSASYMGKMNEVSVLVCRNANAICTMIWGLLLDI